MPVTYQEIIDKLNAEIDVAEKDNQLEVVCEKLVSLCETYIELGFNCMQTLDFSDAYYYFNLAFKQASVFEEYFGSTGEEQSGNELFKTNKQNLYFASAFANFSLGQHNNMTRNPGAAAVLLESAITDFNSLYNETQKIMWSVYSKYCQAFKTYAEGLEDFYRTSFGNAKFKFQRAMVALGNLIEKEIPTIKDDLQGDDKLYQTTLNLFKSDYQTFRSYYYLSDAKQQFNNRNFKNAAKLFESVAKEFDFVLKNYGEALSEPIKQTHLGNYHHHLGWQYLAAAEDYREKEQWQNAMDYYEQVRGEWEQAAGCYLQSGLPSGIALQETILNASLSLDVYQRVCENEKELKEKIAELEQQAEELSNKLITAVKNMGVTVNTTQEVVTTVEQQTQLINNIENNARAGVKELLEALKETGLDDAVKKNIEQKGNEILQSNEKGHKFLDKVKNFTKDIAEIIKNVGEIAKPIIPGFKLLSLLI